MAKKENKPESSRRKLAKGIYLSQVIGKEVQEVLSHYEEEQKIEIAEHLILMFQEIREYFKTKDESVYTKYAERENALLKKYSKAFKPFTSKKFYELFDFGIILSQKDYYTEEEFNNLEDQENDLAELDIKQLTQAMNNLLNGELHYLYLEREPQFETNSEEKSSKDEDDKEMTEARQLLAIYYLLKSGFGIEHRSSNSVSDVTLFAHLLLGKKFTSLQASSIYKKYKLIPNYNKDEQLIKDLKYIKSYFEKLDLQKALELINKELEATIKGLLPAKRKNYL